MEIEIFKPSGYCAGVTKALNQCIELSKENKGGSTFGMISHNKASIETLSENCINYIEPIFDVNYIKENTNVLYFSAHGYPLDFAKKLNNVGIKTYDLTCKYIKDIEKIALENKYIIYIGLIDHLEGNIFHQNFPNAIFYDLKKGFVNTNFDQLTEHHYMVINQSTADEKDIEGILKIFDNLNVSYDYQNTTCNVLKKRYELFSNFVKNNHSNDILYICIGSTSSNNLKTFYKIAKSYTSNIYIAESIKILPKINTTKIKKIILVGGTSTPKESLISFRDELVKTFNN